MGTKITFHAGTIAYAKDCMEQSKKFAGKLPWHARWNWVADGPMVKLQLSMEGQVPLIYGSWNSVTGEGWYQGPWKPNPPENCSN